MFIEKLSDAEILEFIDSVGLELMGEGKLLRLTKTGSYVIATCKPSKNSENLFNKVVSFAGLPAFEGRYVGLKSLSISDFVCVDVMEEQQDYTDQWRDFMFKKFGKIYFDALDEANEEQNKQEHPKTPRGDIQK